MKVNVEVEVQSDDQISEAVVQHISSEFQARCNEDLRKQVREILVAELRTKISEAVTEIFTQVFIPTNEYGEKKGEPMTIRELIVKTTKNYLEEKVDSNGRNDWGGTKDRTRIQWMAKQEADSVVKELVEPEAKKIVSQIKLEAQGKIAKIIVDAIGVLASGK